MISLVTRGWIADSGGGGGETVYVPAGGGAFRLRLLGTPAFRLRMSGMAEPTDVAAPYALDLTEAVLVAQEMAPLVAGDTVTWRFQALDEDGAAVSLAGANIVLTARDKEGGAVKILRRSTVDIVGHSPATKQIGADADQTTENAVAKTGKGWFEVRWRPADELVAPSEDLAAKVGRWRYDLRIEFGDESVRTAARGILEVLRPRTLRADIP